jgi:hypothetical protein
MAAFHASQCGFCTPGIVAALGAALHEAAAAGRQLEGADLAACIDGNLCRWGVQLTVTQARKYASFMGAGHGRIVLKLQGKAARPAFVLQVHRFPPHHGCLSGAAACLRDASGWPCPSTVALPFAAAPLSDSTHKPFLLPFLACRALQREATLKTSACTHPSPAPRPPPPRAQLTAPGCCCSRHEPQAGLAPTARLLPTTATAFLRSVAALSPVCCWLLAESAACGCFTYCATNPNHRCWPRAARPGWPPEACKSCWRRVPRRPATAAAPPPFPSASWAATQAQVCRRLLQLHSSPTPLLLARAAMLQLFCSWMTRTVGSHLHRWHGGTGLYHDLWPRDDPLVICLGHVEEMRRTSVTQVHAGPSTSCTGACLLLLLMRCGRQASTQMYNAGLMPHTLACPAQRPIHLNRSPPPHPPAPPSSLTCW